MSQRLNNVNIKAIEETRKKILNNELPEKKTFIIEGEWVFDKEIQFSGKIEYPNGEMEILTDQVPLSGGYGNAPNPVQICGFGIISCYSTTFMTIASQMGIEIKELKARTYMEVNMKSVFDIEDSPIVEKIIIELEIKTEANKEIIEEIKRIANKKCPAAYVIQNRIPFEAKIKL
ncbi:MAG: OsmC family protein [candidate division WOR-3 bacterium]